jgi:hypothetical protein
LHRGVKVVARRVAEAGAARASAAVMWTVTQRGAFVEAGRSVSSLAHAASKKNKSTVTALRNRRRRPLAPSIDRKSSDSTC